MTCTRLLSGSLKNPLPKEKRLLRRSGTAAPAEGASPNAERQPEGQAAQAARNTVASQQQSTAEQARQIAAATPAAPAPAPAPAPRPAAPDRPGPVSHLKAAWNEVPSGRTVLKAGATLAVAANPIVGVPAVAGAWGIKKLYGWGRTLPILRNIDSGVRSVASTAWEGTKAIGSVLTSPVRVAWHTGKAGLEAVRATLDATIGEVLRDLGHAEISNALVAPLKGIKDLLVGTVKVSADFIMKIPEMLTKVLTQLASHPVRTALGASIAIAAVSNPSAVLPILDKAVSAMVKLIEWIPTILGKLVPAAAAAFI